MRWLGRRRRPDHHRAGAVAEQHRDVAPAGRHVEPGRVDLGADHQDVLVLPGADERVGDRQAVDEAGALLADVEARDLAQPELALGEHARAGEHVVRRQRRVDQHVDVAGLELGLRRAPRGTPWRAIVGAALARSTQWRSSMPVRSTIHSLVVSINCVEVVVGDDARRHVARRARGCDCAARSMALDLAPDVGSDVEVAHVERVLLDELAARLDEVAHQLR